METIKSIGKGLISSPIGAITGGVAGYYAAKKWGNVSNKWAVMGCALVGALVGAAVEYKIKAMTVKPAIAAAKK